MLGICDGNTAKYHFTYCSVNISMFHFITQLKKLLQAKNHFLLHAPEANLVFFFFFLVSLFYVKSLNYGGKREEKELTFWRSYHGGQKIEPFIGKISITIVFRRREEWHKVYEKLGGFLSEALILLFPMVRFPAVFKTQEQSQTALRTSLSQACAITVIKCCGYTLPFHVSFGSPRKARLLSGWKTLISLWIKLNYMAVCDTRGQHWET